MTQNRKNHFVPSRKDVSHVFSNGFLGGLKEGLFLKLLKWFVNTDTMVAKTGSILNFCFMLQIILILALVEAHTAKPHEDQFQRGGLERNTEHIASHSCIHDQILEQRKRPGRKVYSITPQVYEPSLLKPLQHKGRALLGVSTSSRPQKDAKEPIRIYLNYDAVGHSPDRDCREVGHIVKVSVQLAITLVFCLSSIFSKIKYLFFY